MTRIFSCFLLGVVFSYSSCTPNIDLSDIDLTDIQLVDRFDSNLVGKWVSTGDNIAPFLQNTFDNAIDSIYATFGNDESYAGRQVNKDGSVILYEGIYSVSSSFFPDIWGIRIEQTVPHTATSHGIYAIQGQSMRWEVIQTFPSQGHTGATPVGGFGSTSGGRLGDTNIQTFIRIE